MYTWKNFMRLKINLILTDINKYYNTNEIF